MAGSIFRTTQHKARFLAAYDAVLASWPVPFDALDVDTRHGRTRVLACGKAGAPAVILLPCVFGTATVWRPNVEALAKRFRVLCVDPVGQPNYSAEDGAVPSREALAEWLNDLMDGLAIETAAIVGNSYGGFLALNQASLAPHRISKLVLISPAACFVPMPLGISVFGWLLPLLMGRSRRFAASFNRRLQMGIPLDADWLSLMTMAGEAGTTANLKVQPIVFSKAELAAIRAPTLLLIAEREMLYRPQRAVARARKMMPAITAEIVPDANHVAAMSNPRWMNARLTEFLA